MLTTRSPRRNERGVALVLTAITLVVILGMAALVVDLGQGRQRRRTAQNAADATALAAVQELPDGPWYDKGVTYAAENDFTLESLCRGDWNAATRTFTANSCDASGDEGDYIQAITVETGDTMFGGILGRDTQTVRASAVALWEIGSGGHPAIFGGAEECENTIQINGDGVINGGIHSNSDLQFGGGGSDGITVNGDATYVEEGDVQVGNTTFDPPENNPRLVGVKPYPVVIDFSSYQPGGEHAAEAGAQYVYTTDDIDAKWLQEHPDTTNPYLLGGVLRPGLYVTSGDVDLSGGQFGNNVGGAGVSFVAGGTIKVSTNALVITPWDDPDFGAGSPDPITPDPVFVAYGTGANACNSPVINLSGSNHVWAGLIYAPNGLVDISGANNFSLSGNIIAYTVKLTGSNISITAPGDDVNATAEFSLID